MKPARARPGQPHVRHASPWPAAGGLALARAEHRTIVTNNLRDFRPLHNQAITPGGAGHLGMIFMPGSYRRTKADTGKIIASLETILTQYPGETDLADGEAWLQTDTTQMKAHNVAP